MGVFAEARRSAPPQTLPFFHDDLLAGREKEKRKPWQSSYDA